ncbi:cGMP-inhibited 3',5'-cyclic phosphodiesterase 3A-like [Diadema antillarum]|uniref:cGMP-inhibited 3',5'-cyclic phosphodiesterase 3A-like n=1 Tax=Diadema antillarum TaxID=105358 RepID=UPI003A856B98
MDERRPSARYGLDKGYFNLDSSDNNGYIAGTAAFMERRNYNPYLAWFGLKKLKNTGAESRSALAAGVAGIALLMYILQDSFISALHILCGLFAPMFSVICAFYWLAIYLRKTWTGNNVYVFFMACYVGEIFGQICFGAANLFSLWLVASVLASASLVSMTSTLSTPQSALVISFLSFMRFLSGSTLHGLPMWMRPYFAYFCGIAGCVLSKYTEAHLFRRSSIVSPFNNDGKIPVLRRRRTSSQSSVASHSHKTRRTSLPALIQRPQVSDNPHPQVKIKQI